MYCSGAAGYKPWNSVCKGITLGASDNICPSIGGSWHDSIVTESYDPDLICNIAATTSGSTCNDYCQSKGRICMQAQDNLQLAGAPGQVSRGVSGSAGIGASCTTVVP